jgi:hypothetical protein
MRKDDAMDGIGSKMMGMAASPGSRPFSRVLGRLMEAYALGDWEDVMPIKERASAGYSRCGSLFPETLIWHGRMERLSLTKNYRFFPGVRKPAPQPVRVPRKARYAPRKYTASLDELTCLRRGRLH